MMSTFNRLWKKMLPAAILLSLLTQCTGGSGDIALLLPAALQPETGAAQEGQDIRVEVLLLHGSAGISAGSILHHLEQTTVAGARLTVSRLDAAAIDGNPDLVYLDRNLTAEPAWPEVRDRLIAYVERGGTLFLSHEYASAFPASFTGIAAMTAIEDAELNFTYPDVRRNLQGIQQVWRAFSETYARYKGLNPKFHIHFGEGAVTDTAVPLVKKGDLALLTANRAGEGTVIWANDFLPNEQFITRFDLKAEDGQKYFHFGYASANYLFRTELVKFAAKERHGFSVQKAYGPYGRPGMAWQAHYESLYSFVLRDMIKFTELLEKYGQVPTYSLVRGSYNGGVWMESLRYLENVGTDREPRFVNMEGDSFFAAGRALTTARNHLQFGRVPGYNSLLSQVDVSWRAYPTAVDWNRDGAADLIVGTHDGRVYLVEKDAGAADLVFKKPAALKGVRADSDAAPFAVDWNGDGHPDLVLGSGNGEVALYLNNGKQRLKRAGTFTAGGRTLTVAGSSAPAAVDWDGDGILDLIVGDAEGRLHLFRGTASGSLELHAAEPIRADGEPANVGRYAAPFAADWNSDGIPDLLAGNGDGEIVLLEGRTDGTLTNRGPLTGKETNFFGTNTLKPGHNAVPVVIDWNGDGKKDLITGHLEYGNPYAIDSPLFPYAKDLRENLRYVQHKHLPVIPHMYLHEYMSDERERQEIALHKAAFHALGLEWDDDMGVNHHTWRINKDALQTFRNQREAGIWWNFGFNPPNVSTAPRDGVEFLLVIPFLLPDGSGDVPDDPFLLFSPAPHPLNYGRAWDSLAQFDIPLINFDHIEHSMKPGTDLYDKLLAMIAAMNRVREAHKYTFMTEQQIARSLLNTFYADVEVRMSGGRILLTPDYARVPAQVKEYAGTLGVKLELGEAYADRAVDTSGMFYHEGNGGHYIGVPGPTAVELALASRMAERLHVVRSNGPAAFTVRDGALELRLDAQGMQEIEIYSPAPLKVSGADLRVKRDGHYYTIIHYGDRAQVKLKM
jgi:FG-GAP repeat.